MELYVYMEWYKRIQWEQESWSLNLIKWVFTFGKFENKNLYNTIKKTCNINQD